MASQARSEDSAKTVDAGRSSRSILQPFSGRRGQVERLVRRLACGRCSKWAAKARPDWINHQADFRGSVLHRAVLQRHMAWATKRGHHEIVQVLRSRGAGT
jgi:hypothetical protein